MTLDSRHGDRLEVTPEEIPPAKFRRRLIFYRIQEPMLSDVEKIQPRREGRMALNPCREGNPGLSHSQSPGVPQDLIPKLMANKRRIGRRNRRHASDIGGLESLRGFFIALLIRIR